MRLKRNFSLKGMLIQQNKVEKDSVPIHNALGPEYCGKSFIFKNLLSGFSYSKNSNMCKIKVQLSVQEGKAATLFAVSLSFNSWQPRIPYC